jgi:hypothetical protein
MRVVAEGCARDELVLDRLGDLDVVRHEKWEWDGFDAHGCAIRDPRASEDGDITVAVRERRAVKLVLFRKGGGAARSNKVNEIEWFAKQRRTSQLLVRTAPAPHYNVRLSIEACNNAPFAAIDGSFHTLNLNLRT